MNNRNLIVALIALWCYTRNCNINLANNTAILLILYALLSRGNPATFGAPMLEPFHAPRFFRTPAPFAFTQPCQATSCPVY